MLSEAAITTNKPAQPAISFDAAQELINQLEIGRPAVHADHGIGIYEGLRKRRIDGNEREYLMLRYAAGDALSVPVEYAHKVTAYSGSSHPTVHRLGGTIWLKTRRKAQVNAAEFAKELINITKSRLSASRLPYVIDAAKEADLNTNFSFTLTPDQIKVWQEVVGDLTGQHPMDRLIVGDVGFGKTEIAIRASFHVAHNGRQVAVIAPTTLLVQQHADTFKQRLPDFSGHIYTLSRFSSIADKKKVHAAMKSGQAKIVIGTHALLHSLAQWNNLGLAVIDEEQKFGVKQKEHFKKIRSAVDVMSLTATPIPRTLSMALSGLRSLSTIATAPENRLSVETYVGQKNNQVLSNAIGRELDRQGQTYIVAPKVRYLAAIKSEIRTLFPAARLGVAHGQLPDLQLSRTIQAFDAGELDILICSNIVENGLDLPNVNTIIVWQAPHFGLAELYQLRGRVGRRQRQGYAYFLYNQGQLTPLQRERLTAITENARLGSGWSIARRDLEMRGGGNLLGREQSGAIDAVGVGLYLDLISQAVNPDEIMSDTDVQLPISAIIPPDYIADDRVRATWYGRLSRAGNLNRLTQLSKLLVSQFGPAPQEVKNLETVIKLQIIGAKLQIKKIHYQVIAPPDEDQYYRLSVDARDPLKILSALTPIGNWAIRHASLQLDTDKIDSDLIKRIIEALLRLMQISNL